MKKTDLLYAVVNGLVLCVFGSASASPPGADPRLLSLVPPGAAIVAEVTYGSEPTYLALTLNNTADLMDLQSITGVDPTRTIGRTVFVAARGSQGLISEHSLLASGHFDTSHIFKAALENGATQTEFVGTSVLIVRSVNRDKGISQHPRWLAFIGSQIAIFGTIAMVQEELSRYLARSPADLALMGRLSHLRSMDQSWCVLTPTIHNKEIVRRTLAALDPSLLQSDHANDGLIMGIHFGRRVEIEYESVPDSGNPGESQTQTQTDLSQAATPGAPPMASYFFGNNETIPHKIIRLSRKQYHEFIAREETRELTRVGEASGLQSRK
jgi:hypothetical protein